MKKRSAVAQVKKDGVVTSEVDFEYNEATNNTEGEKLAKAHYKCGLVDIFNRYHRMKEIDRIRRQEIARLQDPLRNLKAEVRKLLKTADELTLQSFVERAGKK